MSMGTWNNSGLGKRFGEGNQQEGQSGYVEHERIEDIIRIHIVQSKKSTSEST